MRQKSIIRYLILADAAYDDISWFNISNELDIHLLTDINM